MARLPVVGRFSDAVKERFQHGLGNRYFLATFTTMLAWPWTLLFLRLRLSPNMVSALSFLVSLGGMAVIAGSDTLSWRTLGGTLLIIGLIWDHCDGQVARITRTGSDMGGLLDTILDRWTESGWILAIGTGLLLAPAPPSHPSWLVLLAVAAAIHTSQYLRWSMVQKDIYLVRRTLKEAASTSSDGTVTAQAQFDGPKRRAATVFYLPFFFNRDLTMWMLFVVTLVPWRVEALLAFAALHGLRALEMNWYTLQGLRNGEPNVVARLLDPDYHK